MSHFLRTIKRKEKDYFQLNAKVHDQFGKLKQFNKMTTLEATEENKAKAEAMAAEFEERKKKELDPDCVFYPEMLVPDFLNAWLKERTPELSKRTIRSYKTAIDRAIPYFIPQKLYVHKATPKVFKDFIKALQCKGLHPETIRKTKRVLHNAFQYAVEEELILINPLKAVKTPPIPQKNKGYITTEQFKSILEQVKDPVISAAFFITWKFGLRREEVSALEWKCVDFTNKKLYIFQTTEENGDIVQKTKNKSSTRSFELTNDVIKQLEQLKAYQDEERKRYSPKHQKEDFLFTMSDGYGKSHKEGRGRKVAPSYLTKMFKKACNAANVKGFTFHDLRHGCGSELSQLGFPITDIADFLGHSSCETTARIYSHTNREKQKEMLNSRTL